MAVLVDTSVWSLALRRKKPIPSTEVETLQLLVQDGNVAIIGAIKQEILSGLRFDEQFKKLAAVLISFPSLPVRESDYIAAARICNSCLRAGVRTGTVNCLLAAVAIERDMEILTTDRDFEHMSKIVDLRLYS